MQHRQSPWRDSAPSISSSAAVSTFDDPSHFNVAFFYIPLLRIHTPALVESDELIDIIDGSIGELREEGRVLRMAVDELREVLDWITKTPLLRRTLTRLSATCRIDVHPTDRWSPFRRPACPFVTS